MGVRLLYQQQSTLTLHEDQRIRRCMRDVRWNYIVQCYLVPYEYQETRSSGIRLRPKKNARCAETGHRHTEFSAEIPTEMRTVYVCLWWFILYEPHSKHCGHWLFLSLRSIFRRIHSLSLQHEDLQVPGPIVFLPETSNRPGSTTGKTYGGSRGTNGNVWQDVCRFTDRLCRILRYRLY